MEVHHGLAAAARRLTSATQSMDFVASKEDLASALGGNGVLEAKA
jgi:hypothetical protein